MSYQRLSMQVLALLLITAIAVAEVPQLISYQLGGVWKRRKNP